MGEVAPRWVLIENVPGLLSSHGGRDFATVLSGLADLGYGWAYRILDSQFFGVPQRRRRVFVVGCSGDAGSAFRALHPVGTGLPGHPAPSREARERTAEGAAGGVGGAFALSSHASAADAIVSNRSHAKGGPTGLGVSKDLAYSLRSKRTQGVTQTWPDTAMPLMERDYKGPRNYRDGGIQAMCVQSVPRRLTPVECERLQGFPDGWTEWGLDRAWERVELADGPRYRQMGNAVTVNVAEWIGRHILEVDRDDPDPV
ncbi:MAG: DNA (cytosine-5-)-methyltransferase [Planctomycetes bacterium]|nr:DNA (cytosine-5-)-methyltransferase [Planctomycetota bacterium]